jgi:hypothetical protein
MTMLTALPETVRGLPLHVLVVHAVVVLAPLAALAALGSAVWPAVRRHFGAASVVVAAVATALVPIATGSGENFERRLGAEELVRDHSRWAGRMLPAMLVLLASVLVLVVLDIATRSARLAAAPVEERVGALATAGVRGTGSGPLASERPSDAGPVPPLTFLDRRVAALFPAGLSAAAAAGRLRIASIVVAVVVVVAALVALWVVLQTGESGARAVWGGR